MNHSTPFSLPSSSNRKIQVPVGLLETGMFVCDLDRPWQDSPFLIQGFELRTQADIEAVRKVCDYVYIDVGKQSRDPRRIPEPYDSIPFEAGIGAAYGTYQAASNLVKTTMEDIRFGKAIDTGTAKTLVAECVRSILDNPSPMLLLTQLKERDEYTSQHSMNVCILSIILGRELRLFAAELEHLGLCGLLHDMGKMQTPLEVLNKRGKLNDKEFRIMQQHVLHGRNILMSARGVYPGAVDVAYSHHERIDGQGYPRGLRGENITRHSKIVAIADAYDAITSDRVYQQGRSHLTAINILTKCRATHFEPRYVISFIACIGIYPPGSIVEMRNGEVGIVIEAGPRNKTRPRVLLVRDSHKAPCPERIVDLQNGDTDSDDRPYQIKDVLCQSAHGINIKNHLRRLLNQPS